MIAINKVHFICDFLVRRFSFVFGIEAFLVRIFSPNTASIRVLTELMYFSDMCLSNDHIELIAYTLLATVFIKTYDNPSVITYMYALTYRTIAN